MKDIEQLELAKRITGRINRNDFLGHQPNTLQVVGVEFIRFGTTTLIVRAAHNYAPHIPFDEDDFPLPTDEILYVNEDRSDFAAVSTK